MTTKGSITNTDITDNSLILISHCKKNDIDIYDGIMKHHNIVLLSRHYDDNILDDHFCKITNSITCQNKEK
jgi:hypothetical protein